MSMARINRQAGMSSDERTMTFTEQGLAVAIRGALDALEGDPDGEVAGRASELAVVIFAAAAIEKRGLLDTPPSA